MSIDALSIGNFKGISELARFEIKPLTFFIGPNSSGKSTCIHGLGSLAQTIKMSNDKQPLILDGDHAQLNLGRFIEIIHSKKYDDTIGLGIEIDEININLSAFGKDDKQLDPKDSCKAIYFFKCSKKTQNIYIESAKIEVSRGGTKRHFFEFKKTGTSPSKNEYSVTTIAGKSYPATVQSGFMFQVVLKTTQADDMELLKSFFVIQAIQEKIVETLKNCIYLGPFRESPLRRYPTKGSRPYEVGSSGAAAVTMLANESVENSRTRPHSVRISDWLRQLGLAKGVAVTRVGTSDLFDVLVEMTDGVTLPIADMGYGLSQILPVLVQCSFANKGATLLFEQPELHLHQGAAEKLAKVFIETIAEKNVKIVAETHSRELFIQTLREINAGNFDPNNLVAYRVLRVNGHSEFTKIDFDIDANGKIESCDPWDTSLSQ